LSDFAHDRCGHPRLKELFGRHALDIVFILSMLSLHAENEQKKHERKTDRTDRSMKKRDEVKSCRGKTSSIDIPLRLLELLHLLLHLPTSVHIHP
jgi:hypothetical protein